MSDAARASGVRPLRACVMAVTFALACSVAGERGRALAADDPAYAIEITSPLGRSGLPGKVRFVARITTPDDADPPPVKFFVDDALLATDTDGPPYAVEWEDINPYEKSRLSVEIDLPAGGTARDEVELLPFEFIEESQVMSVGLDATVQNAQGKYLGSLSTTDFMLYEDGEPQDIDSLSTEAVPATFAMLVDSSQSMSRNIDFVQQAAARLVGFLRKDDNVIVVPFRNGITSVTGPTRDPATVRDAVAEIKPRGGTAIMDALSQVTERFGDGIGRRVVVLITDGYDERSQGSPDAVLERLKKSRVTVYVISIGGVAGVSIAGERLLRRIAGETGGRAFFPWNAQQLRDAHEAMADDIRHQYRITYTPTNQEQDGTWRVITVATTDTNHRVLARPGYRAPSPAPVRASLEFTAVDERQQYVDLTTEDLQIIEDGVPQTVDVFNEAVTPVSIMLAIDASGSMTRSASAARDAARAFVETLRKDDPLGLVVFADKAEVEHDLSTNRQLSRDALDAYATKGGTALYDAIADSAGRLRTVSGRRVVVVVTDGRDENAASNGPGSERSWDDALNAATDAETTVYAIGLGSRVDQDRLRQLADATGGEAYFTSDVAELEGHYRRIVEELHRRYIVAYTSTNGARDGSWRKVEIKASTPGVRIRTRGGYYAPGRR